MLRYTKMEGCGNDFAIVDLRGGPAGAPPDRTASSAEAARAICDRHFGAGADGVLALLPPEDPAAVALMRVWNADGSEAEMCGNGIRCVAKYLYERDPRARIPELPIETGAGLLRCGVTLDARRHVTEVSVSMGRPRLAAAEVPVAPQPPASPAEPVIDREVEVEGRRFRFTAVSMGNPHAVIFLPELPGTDARAGRDGDEALRSLAGRYGPALERHPWFPRRTNVEFARVVGPRHLDLVVWERGCGITLACGTGACATVVAACVRGILPTGEDVLVSLPGGDLTIRVDADYAGVTLRGPAFEVYDGELDLAPLLQRSAARTGSHAPL